MVVEKECLNAVLRPIPTVNLVSALVANAEVLDIHTGLMKIVVDAEPQIARQQNGGFLYVSQANPGTRHGRSRLHI